MELSRQVDTDPVGAHLDYFRLATIRQLAWLLDIYAFLYRAGPGDQRTIDLGTPSTLLETSCKQVSNTVIKKRWTAAEHNLSIPLSLRCSLSRG